MGLYASVCGNTHEERDHRESLKSITDRILMIAHCSSDEIDTDSDEVRDSNYVHIVQSPSNIEWTSSNFFY